MAKTTSGSRRKPVRWGIISTARIGIEHVIPAMMKAKGVKVDAVASRSLGAARKLAGKFDIPVAYGSYDELFADPDIEAVYNPLPNHLHVPMTLAAAASGKHVLCEKPIALNAAEAKKLKSAPKGIHIAEAFMVRHHPQWIRAREIVRSGKLGSPRAAQVFFSYFNRQPNNIRNDAAIGGGALYDIGCYAIITGRYLFDAEPRRVVALIDRDPDFRTDRTTSALLDFGDGRHLTFTASTQTVAHQRASVLGTKGRLEIVIPYNPTADTATRIILDDGKKLGDVSAKPIRIAKSDQYQREVESFSRLVRGLEKLAYGIDDAILQMRIIDALFRSEKSGRWERP